MHRKLEFAKVGFIGLCMALSVSCKNTQPIGDNVAKSTISTEMSRYDFDTPMAVWILDSKLSEVSG